MARIVGGIGTSHVPTAGMAYDKGKQNEPAWAPLFKGYEPVAAWLAARKPDALVMFYNDHANSFSSTVTRPSSRTSRSIMAAIRRSRTTPNGTWSFSTSS